MGKAGVGVASVEVAKSLTGLEFLKGIVEGRLPAPPITASLDFEIIEVDKGFAAFRGRPAFSHYNPMGAVHGGYAQPCSTPAWAVLFTARSTLARDRPRWR